MLHLVYESAAPNKQLQRTVIRRCGDGPRPLTCGVRRRGKSPSSLGVDSQALRREK